MELGRETAPALDRGDEGLPVLDGGRAPAGRWGLEGIGVREVGPAVVEDPRSLGSGHPIPSELRKGAAPKTARLARHDAEPPRPLTLLAALEQHLQADADRQGRPIGADARAQCVGKARRIEGLHRRPESADPGKDDVTRDIHVARGGGEAGTLSEVRAEREDGGEIRHPSRHYHQIVHNTPLVLGISSEPVGLTAIRSARASALNAASARW